MKINVFLLCIFSVSTASLYSTQKSTQDIGKITRYLLAEYISRQKGSRLKQKIKSFTSNINNHQFSSTTETQITEGISILRIEPKPFIIGMGIRKCALSTTNHTTLSIQEVRKEIYALIFGDGSQNQSEISVDKYTTFYSVENNPNEKECNIVFFNKDTLLMLTKELTNSPYLKVDAQSTISNVNHIKAN